MFYKILDHIRTKPKPVRDQYAFGIALTASLLIAGVWSLSLPSRFAAPSVASVGVASTTAPFAGILGQIKEQFFGAKALLQTPPATTTVITTASSTTAALELEISAETKASFANPPSSVRFASTTFGNAAPSTAAPTRPILIATSSAALKPAE
jgi:hypothetical protein